MSSRQITIGLLTGLILPVSLLAQMSSVFTANALDSLRTDLEEVVEQYQAIDADIQEAVADYLTSGSEADKEEVNALILDKLGLLLEIDVIRLEIAKVKLNKVSQEDRHSYPYVDIKAQLGGEIDQAVETLEDLKDTLANLSPSDYSGAKAIRGEIIDFHKEDVIGIARKAAAVDILRVFNELADKVYDATNALIEGDLWKADSAIFNRITYDAWNAIIPIEDDAFKAYNLVDDSPGVASNEAAGDLLRSARENIRSAKVLLKGIFQEVRDALAAATTPKPPREPTEPTDPAEPTISVCGGGKLIGGSTGYYCDCPDGTYFAEKETGSTRCVDLPQNAYAIPGGGWACDSGYTNEGGRCEQLSSCPPGTEAFNGGGYSVCLQENVGSCDPGNDAASIKEKRWTCSCPSGYEISEHPGKVGPNNVSCEKRESQKVVIPKNAYEADNARGWVCADGYEERATVSGGITASDIMCVREGTPYGGGSCRSGHSLFNGGGYSLCLKDYQLACDPGKKAANLNELRWTCSCPAGYQARTSGDRAFCAKVSTGSSTTSGKSTTPSGSSSGGGSGRTIGPYAL